MEAKDLYPLVKKLKISQRELMNETGYSLVYISRAMNGRIKSHKRFNKLLVILLAKRMREISGGLSDIIKDSDWETYLP